MDECELPATVDVVTHVALSRTSLAGPLGVATVPLRILFGALRAGAGVADTGADGEMEAVGLGPAGFVCDACGVVVVVAVGCGVTGARFWGSRGWRVLVAVFAWCCCVRVPVRRRRDESWSRSKAVEQARPYLHRGVLDGCVEPADGRVSYGV